MKNLKKILILMSFILVFSAFSSTTHVQAASISKTKVTLLSGQSVSLKVNGKKGKVKWSSSKKSVATVNSKGLVKAKKKGTAKITAKIGKKKYTCKVTVQSPKLSKTKLSLKYGKSYKLNLSGTNQKVKWSSSNTNVAIVSSKGKISTIGNGTAIITARVLGKNFSCKVTVSGKKASSTNAVVKPQKRFSSTEAMKNISKRTQTMGGTVVCFLNSNYEFPTSTTADCYFFDKSGKIVSTSFSYCFWLEKGREGVLIFREPDSEYDHYEIKYDMFQSAAYIGNESVVEKIKVTSNHSKDGIYCRVYNDFSKSVDAVNLIIKYYDSSNHLVAVKGEPVYDINSHDYKIEEVYYPINYITYEDISYSRYEVIVSTATYSKY